MDGNGTAVAHERLGLLVGRWDVELTHPDLPEGHGRGTMQVEWGPGGRFIVQRSRPDDPRFPDSLCVVGWDEDAGSYLQHYFDSRGVCRIFRMTLAPGTWRLERDDDPDFHQRFVGTISPDNATIEGAWERSSDQGATWELDFPMSYRRAPE
jgi:hypothetical protein